MTTQDSIRRVERRFTAATIVLSIGATFFFLGALSWVFHRNRAVTTVFQYAFAANVACFVVLIGAQLVYYSRYYQPRQPKKIYAFLRRFGMGTLLALTLAFGALSALCRWSEWPTEVVLGILLFFGIVSVVQFIFDRAPRQASILAGTLFVAVCVAAWWRTDDQRVTFFRTSDLTFFAAVAIIHGALAGYCVGTLDVG